MEKDEFKALLKRYETGRCAPEESARVEEWFHAVARDAPEPTSEPNYRKLGKRLYAQLGIPQDNRTRWRARVARALPYAATVAILLTVGWLLLDMRRETSDRRPAAEEILPGYNQATLTLADGTTISLDSAQSGIVVSNEDIKYQNGNSLPGVILSEGSGNGPGGTEGSLPNLLSLSTPKGGQYQIILSDGSKVWLNSSSTLKYPSRFSDGAREVFLEGEAFFEIKKIQGTRDTRAPAASDTESSRASVMRAPFKVMTSTQTIEVLGTQFNISAYTDEAETRTTLVEGKVRVSHLKSHVSNLLSPGQQATTRGAATTVNEVDVESYTSWKSGLFVLSDTPLYTAIRQLERWYDVEFVGEVDSDKKVSAILPRAVNLSAVLNALAENTEMKFTVTGRRVMVQH